MQLEMHQRNLKRRYQLALAVAMGRDVDSVLVDSQRTAERCIQWLKDNRRAVLTFVPLDSCKAKAVRLAVQCSGLPLLYLTFQKWWRSWCSPPCRWAPARPRRCAGRHFPLYTVVYYGCGNLLVARQRRHGSAAALLRSNPVHETLCYLPCASCVTGCVNNRGGPICYGLKASLPFKMMISKWFQNVPRRWTSGCGLWAAPPSWQSTCSNSNPCCSAASCTASGASAFTFQVSNCGV